MNKSKIVLVASCIFSLVFLVYIFKMSRDLSSVEDIIVSSPNVVDVTEKIQTKLLVTPENIEGKEWASPTFDDKAWTTVSIPKHRIVSEKEFKENNFAYYRIHIPRESFKHLKGLENQLFITLQYVEFHKMDIYLNGEFYRTNTPVKSLDFMTNLPINDKIDNVISIKGSIRTGDSGINHRGRILVGKGGELNEFYNQSYKAMTVRGLIFLLCKGSILFIFTLLFLVLKVDKFFEKSLLYAMFVVLEDILTGDYVYDIFNLNQQVYLYDLVDLGINTFLFLFIADVLQIKFNRKTILLLASAVGISSLIISLDLLHTSYLFNIDHLLKFWNWVFICNLIFFLPRLYKTEKVFFTISLIAIGMTTWSALFSSNVGLNLKAFGNLLIFFGVAYQTFILFRRQQILLFEQEKDVAIGKTAAILAHDVRRPLEQMSLILNQIDNGDVSEDFIKIAKKDIGFSLGVVNNQINDIMNFSRVQKLDLKAVSFYSILESSIKQVISTKVHLDLALEYDFKCDNLVLADESRLASVLTNLIGNAVEAIEVMGNSLEGEIKFSTQRVKDKFVFKIFNTGPTIPEEQITEIFKPLYTSGKVKGTGLGLASVQKIINDHYGTILVQNINQAGVEFAFELQKTQERDEVKRYDFRKNSKLYTYVTTKPEVTKELKHLRVFLLDDDKYSFEYIQKLIQESGLNIELDYSNNYDEAKKKVKSKRYDLYLLDYDLSGEKSGINFYQEELGFLKDEVVLYSSRQDFVLGDNLIQKVDKPMSGAVFLELCLKANYLRKEILLVEDSKIISIGWLMFHGKHNLHIVNSPEEAIAFLETGLVNVDCCVVDLNFDNSDKDGLWLGSIVKSRFGLPILISTSAINNDLRFLSIKKNDYDVRRWINTSPSLQK